MASTTTPKIVKPEALDNFEIGLKATLLNNRLLLDDDAFWDEDQNYQSTLEASNAGGSAFTYISGIPKVRSWDF